ncbi:expansin-A12-like [Hibiscus syriacus]|uniref:Expansin-A12-like n=1 Tax=Hibiscus syriacus TaxID=106335 RepID=A0A6A2XUT1_HIBSY|nr:expansin-A12-like [Hibiscus syriacus]
MYTVFAGDETGMTTKVRLGRHEHGFVSIRNRRSLDEWTFRAPIAGSAVDQVVGYASLGYPFGMMASILFSRHHNAILQSSKPKLFVMGTRDGFTGVKQLQNKLKTAAGHNERHLIGVSHFQMVSEDKHPVR